MDEFAGNNSAWPPNVPGKPTQLAVFAIGVRKGNPIYEITFTATYPDLDKAMYWGAKKEIEVIKAKKFTIASRVIWQHDLTAEQAVAEMWQTMEPQVRRALSASSVGGTLASLGEGPMKPVDYASSEGIYIEFDGPDPSLN